MNSRFDLETALAAWRRSLTHNGAFLAEDVDELERHVRDQVAGLTADGVSEETAFHRALAEMGDYGAVEAEYHKVYWGKRRRRREVLDDLQSRLVMLKTFFKITFRQFARRPGYSFINVAGLAVGMACCLIVLTAVRHELSYDRFHSDAERLYRVVQDVSWAGGMVWDWTPAVVAPTLAEDFPEIEATARFHRISALVSNEAAGGELRFQEDAFAFVDPSFLDLFAVSFVAGDPETALDAPRSVVLTRSAAATYFGTAAPMGKTLRLDGKLDVTVTGVIDDPPSNTHLDFDFLASFATLHPWYNTDAFTSWWWPSMQTYVRLAEGADAAHLNAEGLPAFVARHREPHFAKDIIPRLQSVTDIHLYGNPGGRAIRFVYIFSLIGAFVLLIACVNYMNLATARSTRRAREVGLRKVAGARRGQLAGQFYAESLVVVLVALLAGLLLARLALPAFNRLSGLTLYLDASAAWLWLFVAGLAAAVTVLAGSYPALFLSRFSPIRVLKGGPAQAAGGRGLRQGLVVMQFVITIVLIAGALVVYGQVDYMRTATLGFDTEQVVSLRLREGPERYEALKEEILRQPNVLSVSATNWFPGVTGGGIFASTLGSRDLDNDPTILFVDPDFFQTLGIEVVAGRSLSHDFPSDRTGAFLLNEAAVRQYEVDAPIGERLHLFAAENGRTVYEKEGEVVGVVRDFHLTDLRTPIYPAALTLAEAPYLLTNVLVRLAPGNTRATLARLEEVWDAYFPERPFELSFVNEEIDAMYRQEAQFGQAIGILATLAVFIACLGLFGLAAFTAEQRTKEIGIRKVLGASVPGLVALLSRDFLKLVLAAFVVAAPLAYLAMDRWLSDFAYRIDLGPLPFVIGGVLALTIALATVSYQAVRAAHTDPVKSLRYE